MAIQVTPTNIQKMEFEVSTAEGPCRVTLVTGSIPLNIQAFSNSDAFINESASLSALVDPQLTPGQFRKATATAAIAAMGDGRIIPGGVPAGSLTHASAKWSVNEVRASLDDESGQIEIRIEVTVTAQNSSAFLQKINFQVTTLAKI